MLHFYLNLQNQQNQTTRIIARNSTNIPKHRMTTFSLPAFGQTIKKRSGKTLERPTFDKPGQSESQILVITLWLRINHRIDVKLTAGSLTNKRAPNREAFQRSVNRKRGPRTTGNVTTALFYINIRSPLEDDELGSASIRGFWVRRNGLDFSRPTELYSRTRVTDIGRSPILHDPEMRFNLISVLFIGRPDRRNPRRTREKPCKSR